MFLQDERDGGSCCENVVRILEAGAAALPWLFEVIRVGLYYIFI